MNIRNVSNSGGVDRGGDRPIRVDGKRESSAAASSTGDKAAISSDGRDAKAAFEANVDVVRAEGSDRAAIVSRAMEKLKSGELDTEAVYRDAASRLLATDFRTA
jgi:hypothetical protein